MFACILMFLISFNPTLIFYHSLLQFYCRGNFVMWYPTRKLQNISILQEKQESGSVLRMTDAFTCRISLTRRGYSWRWSYPHFQDWILSHQFGFRKAHSTIQQCHRIIGIINRALEKKNLLSVIPWCKPSIWQSLAPGTPLQNPNNLTSKISQHPKVLPAATTTSSHIQQRNLPPSTHAIRCSARKYTGSAPLHTIYCRHPPS